MASADTAHGALFDLFPEHATNVHGGALYDEGFGLQSKDAPKGATFDEFGVPTYDPQHGGPLWDEFAPWQSVDEAHGGLLYDQGFAEPSANTTSRGPLFDLFEGKQARYMFDGQDAEGIVVKVREDGIAEVQPRQGGQVVEVELGQFLALASPSMDNAGTTAPRSTAEAPSAWSPDAHGGGRGAPPSPGQPIEPTPQGRYTEPRSGVPDGAWSVVDGLKSLLDGVDVAKTVSLPSDRVLCGDCKGHGIVDAVDALTGATDERKCRTCQGRGHNHVNFERSRGRGEKHVDYEGGEILKATKTFLPSDGLRSWSAFGQVAKEVSVAETAIQAEDNAAAFAGPKNAGSYCPECRMEKDKLTDDGRCPDCNTVITAHHKAGPVPREKGDGNGDAESSTGKGVADKTTGLIPDVLKAFGAPGDARPGGQTNTIPAQQETPTGKPKQAKGDPPDVPVPERAHASSDHHSDFSQPRACPHCGQPLSEENHQTDQGAPSNSASGGGKFDPPVTAHKCLEGFLDTLKVAA